MSTSTLTRSTETLTPPHATARPTSRTRLDRAVRGRSDDPRWVRPALLVLLGATGLLYLWGLGASGYANSFYAAAAQAGSMSWKAWFFASLDPSNFITVDKPPASLWVMGLSVRAFGLSGWSLLVPQALEGIATVALLHATVRRVAGPGAGLLAGAALALTPAATLMFRFDNPDALLTLLLVAAAYAVTRALENGATRWLVLAGGTIGFAFLTKMLQGFLTLPALALVNLLFAPVSFRRRIVQLLAAGVSVVVSAGWWVAIAQLWPASSRPYISGSGDNTVLGLALGYNGLGRIFGGTGNGGGGGGAAGSSFGGATGLARLFSSEMGNEVSWLLPAALFALVAGLVATRRSPRTQAARAALVLWGGWLLVTGLVFSYMKGTVHPYYTVALAPAVAALVAIGAQQLWVRRETFAARASLATLLLAAAGWSVELLSRNAFWHPALRYALLVGALAAAVGLVVTPRRMVRATAVLALVGVLAGLGGSSAYAVSTASQAHTGSIPSVGPVSAQSMGGGMGGGRGFGGAPPSGSGGTAPDGTTAGGSSSSTQLASLLSATDSTWAAATVGATTAADLQLASGRAVMDLGGWNGSDDVLTLAQFEQYIAQGKIHYFVAGGMGGGGMGGGTSSTSAITAYVTSHFTATTVGGSTVYDLTSPTS